MIKKIPLTRNFFVPRAGLEPASLAARDFKSLVYTIPPPGQIMKMMK